MPRIVAAIIRQCGKYNRVCRAEGNSEMHLAAMKEDARAKILRGARPAERSWRRYAVRNAEGMSKAKSTTRLAH